MKRTTQGFSHLLLTLTLLLSMVGCSGKEPPQANRSDAAPTALTIADLKEILSALDASNSTLTYCNGENEETHPANAAIRTKKYIKELQDYDVWETCQPPENWNPSGEYYYKFHGDGISLISYQNGFTGLQPFHVTTDTGDGWFRLSDIPAEQDNSAQQFGWMVYDTFGKWYSEARTADLYRSTSPPLTADELDELEAYTACQVSTYIEEWGGYTVSPTPISCFFTSLYLAGRSVQNIRQALEASGVRNAAGTTEWTTSNLRSILTNEKYCGDALLQKTFIKDCISKKAILNTGQLPKVLIQDNHEAIVSREMFDAVQLEIARRRAQDGRTRKSAPTGRGKFSGKYALSGLLFCAECGTAYRRVVWTQHGEKRAVWRCTSRLDYGKRYCLHSPTLDEGPLQQAILSAVNSAMSDHGTLTAQLIDTMEQELAPIPGESMSLGDIDRATEGLGQQFNDLLREAADANNVDSYTAQFQSISTAMAEFKRRKAKILQIRQEQEQTNRRVQAVASVLKTSSSELTEWDDNVVYQLLEKVTVLSRERIRVTLRDGLEIEQAVEQPKRRKFA